MTAAAKRSACISRPSSAQRIRLLSKRRRRKACAAEMASGRRLRYTSGAVRAQEKAGAPVSSSSRCLRHPCRAAKIECRPPHETPRQASGERSSVCAAHRPSQYAHGREYINRNHRPDHSARRACSRRIIISALLGLKGIFVMLIEPSRGVSVFLAASDESGASRGEIGGLWPCGSRRARKRASSLAFNGKMLIA